MLLNESWRWFGPNDPISLDDIRMSGAESIVTALHHIPIGTIWSQEEILHRKVEIEAKGLHWSVVESVPVHESIKKGTADAPEYINAYKQTLRNLAANDIRIVCYNFMPVLDWTRTNLNYRFSDGSKALRFDSLQFAAFDLFVLKRSGAEKEYSASTFEAAKIVFNSWAFEDIQNITKTILSGLPGSFTGYNLSEFRAELEAYKTISEKQLLTNLIHFLKEIVPVAEENGIYLTIHPDDPPFPLFGLPRIVSNPKQLQQIFSSVSSSNNGLCFCTGSFGANSALNLTAMAKEFAGRIHFVHLRNVKTDPDGSFTESNHLEGQADMIQILSVLQQEKQRRFDSKFPLKELPFRPDHGHAIAYDLAKKTNPGYTFIGRLRGLAELRGVQLALQHLKIVKANG